MNSNENKKNEESILVAGICIYLIIGIIITRIKIVLQNK